MFLNMHIQEKVWNLRQMEQAFLKLSLMKNMLLMQTSIIK